jgi:forkhead box protein J2/3
MSAPPQGMPPMLAEGQDISANYYPPENDLTGGLPINLDSLRDGPPGSKPFYPYSTLIRSVPLLFLFHSLVVCFIGFVCSCHLFSYAIKGSPNQKLLLEDIYYAIESRVRYAYLSPRIVSCSVHTTVPLFQDGAQWLEGKPVPLLRPVRC